jgi:hypothetical protein
LLALTLAGCGASTSSNSSAAARAAAEAATEAAAQRLNREIALESPALVGANTIPSRYTCDGADVRLPLRWASVPPGARELVLIIVSLHPVTVREERQINAVTATWAVAGLPPTLRQLSSGRLPRGVVVGRTNQGQKNYSICPPKGTTQSYLITLFGLPRPISTPPGFNDEALFSELRNAGIPFGQIIVNYTRR